MGHEPRHGTAYVGSWIKALENDPKEIRAAAVDAQRSTDWLLARERERSREKDTAAHERLDGGDDQAREPRDQDRQPRVAREVTTGAQADRDTARSPQMFNPAMVNDRQQDAGPSR